MNPSTPEDDKSQRTVMEWIADRTGKAPKVLLSDSNSEHGTSPVIAPGAAATRLLPQGPKKYQLLGEIARGGMGVILKGHDTDLGRDVALKVLDGELAKRPEVVQRFVEEAQIGGQLQHPGIVPVYDLGLMADDSPYFTMKLVKGRTLSVHFQQRQALTDDRARLLAIFESVCQTVAYAHSKGVLHRDLKPANIMVGAFGEVQVVDWGLAKVLQRGGIADERRAQGTLYTVIETVRSGPGSSGSDSLVGSVMGTPAYMAPEQAQGEVDLLDERADVFSLGAILCELLTGRPPYEPIEGESLVSQAAHAKLAPARARIAACEADPALVKLCLDCLMTTREARPANAEIVARILHEYLASVEQRAQKAELAAAEARIKAAEERRARRLTVALAGAIAVALLLGGGGYWWVSHEREQRLEQTRAVVEAAWGESIEFSQAGKPAQALTSARRALSLAESGDADGALLERARSFVAKAEQDVGTADRERVLEEQDQRLLSRLIDLRLQQFASLGDGKREAELDAAFTQAFHDYGVDLEGDDLVPALQRIRDRAIAEDVALTLDFWGHLRRPFYGAKSEQVENLFVLAMDLDPDPVRMRMREAIAARDLDVMLELTSPDNLPKLGPGSICVLCAALSAAFPERQSDVFRIAEQALALYPGDYELQAASGIGYQQANRWEQALACRTAALALRPGDVTARTKMAESQYYLGRLADAQITLRACTAADPGNKDANYLLGIVQFLLGDSAGALASLSRSSEITADANTASDLYVAQFFNGVITREALKRHIATEASAPALATYLYALLDHPDPDQRDPEFVLRTLDERSALFGGARIVHMLDMVARIRLADWSGALEVYEGPFKPPLLMLITPMSYDFIAALIYAHVGRDVEAQQACKRGMLAWEAQTRDNPAAWEHSDAMRWRREAEAALAK